ncbi:hypothetical protein [Lederbergia lenta]|uniref:Putative integral inner membrane protein n=1 Tax=Lederbergia lenta TaxID=1467 RepID=A0A2X4W4I8_LEDLE|nr:hypothetical protein [Lederbergia lenta]MEC2324815.1 hypothetical protein [Lederbergia lenta]SQI57609.1 putative integral inner membrane protein [Lederbergia lenta]
MFTFNDMMTFVIAFFVTLPLVALIHSLGHLFFAKLFGGKIKLALGRGKTLLSYGIFELRLVYFFDSECHYQQLKINNKWTHCLVHAGGIIFNILAIVLVNSSIYLGILPKHLFFYQFVYFSVYYIFFSLLPIQYGENHFSDGKSIVTIIRTGSPPDLFD